MFAISPMEWGVLVVWAGGVVAAIYVTWGAGPLLRRVLIVGVAVLVPVLGSLGAIGLAIFRLRRQYVLDRS